MVGSYVALAGRQELQNAWTKIRRAECRLDVKVEELNDWRYEGLCASSSPSSG